MCKMCSESVDSGAARPSVKVRHECPKLEYLVAFQQLTESGLHAAMAEHRSIRDAVNEGIALGGTLYDIEDVGTENQADAGKETMWEKVCGVADKVRATLAAGDVQVDEDRRALAAGRD